MNEKLIVTMYVFKVDRPQTTVVAKNLFVLQLFISRMPKMCAILQLVSAFIPSGALKGVMRVGVLAKGLLLHERLDVNLVVLCHGETK